MKIPFILFTLLYYVAFASAQPEGRQGGQCLEGDCKDGFGKFLFASGDWYEGDWANSEMDGTGSYHYITGDVYDGEFHEGMRYGYGVYRWKQGDFYAGGYYNNKRHGRGTYTDIKGNITMGYFENGEMTEVSEGNQNTELSKEVTTEEQDRQRPKIFTKDESEDAPKVLSFEILKKEDAVTGFKAVVASSVPIADYEFFINGQAVTPGYTQIEEVGVVCLRDFNIGFKKRQYIITGTLEVPAVELHFQMSITTFNKKTCLSKEVKSEK